MSAQPQYCATNKLGNKQAGRVGRELAKIERQAGELTPEIVLERARSESSPLHKHFTWDDSEAAHSFRLVQAAWLIRTVKVRVIVNDKPAETRAFVRVVKEPRGPASYVNLRAALANPDWREQLLADALQELENFRRKYAVLKELAPLLKAMGKVIAKRTTQARRGAAPQGVARPGEAGVARLGPALQGTARQARPGAARLGKAGRGNRTEEHREP